MKKPYTVIRTTSIEEMEKTVAKAVTAGYVPLGGIQIEHWPAPPDMGEEFAPCSTYTQAVALRELVMASPAESSPAKTAKPVPPPAQASSPAPWDEEGDEGESVEEDAAEAEEPEEQPAAGKRTKRPFPI